MYEKEPQQLVILQEANFTLQCFLKNIVCVTLSREKETNLVQKDIFPLGTYSRHRWVCMGQGPWEDPATMSAQHPLLAPLCSSTAWPCLGAPHSWENPHWHLTKVRNSSRETSLLSEYMSLPSTVNPPWEPLLVCRFIFLHHFPHSSSEQTHKEPPFSILVTWGGSLAWASNSHKLRLELRPSGL